MVELGGAALRFVVDARAVALEGGVAGVDGDGDGSNGGDGFLQGILVFSRGDVDVTNIVALGASLSIMAGSVLKTKM